MQKVHRTYSDNGELVRFEIKQKTYNHRDITNEMNTRARRYHAQSNTRALIIDTLLRATILLTTMTILVAIYLINN
jgi:hypothetical protein